MTSDGTESTVMVIKVSQSFHLLFRVVPASAHTAFDKGAAYLKVKLYSIPVDPITRTADGTRVKRAM